jgi:formylglycine-generating enzyme required for sulfatase activity/predicted Ser/Thr protein kinase
MSLNDDNAPDDEASVARRTTRSPNVVGVGEQPTRDAEEAVLDTAIDEFEVVDLEARYKIEGTLGQGGMGAVLLATDTRLGRKVAIKRILGKGANSRAAIRRFLTEAKAIAALNHPNVVQIYDYGRAKDGPFLIMEYVDGGNLAERCTQRTIPLEEAVNLTCQICDGLAKAHAAGIVHRDIKPANVLLSRDGHPKLSDFGLAKAEAADHQMTMAGAVIGTPDFMPPEQRLDAALVDARSDLWSLAATLYQMVTGRNPKIIRFDLVPAELAGVLAKALEENKEDRFQSAREFRDALRAATWGTMSVVGADTAADVEIHDGQCKACGFVHSDLSRKFCKKCGASLRVACLQCQTQIPVWDLICGECGGNQAQLSSATEDADDPEESFASYDDASAIHAVGSLADPLHTVDASGLLEECHSQQGEFEGLVTIIAQRIKQNDVDGLIPAVERAVELQEDRQDLAEFLQWLVERRNARLTNARAALDADKPSAAVAALAGAVADDFPFSRELRDLLDRVQRAVAIEHRVADAVKQAKGHGTVTPTEAVAILGLCTAYLTLVPKSERMAKLKSQCERVSSVINSIGMKLRLVAPGTFTMGQPYGEADETPHPVTLTKPFSIGVYQVTNAQWKRLMGRVPSNWPDDDRPVEQVSWQDAVDFCTKLSALPAERKARRVYRLPTEAEWEYACRAGTTTNFSFGDDESWLGEHGWFDGNSDSQTHPVGQKLPNSWGLYDMHGNVLEWCSDWSEEYSKASATDPHGPATASARVARGGSCSSSAGRCRSAFRYGLDPSCRIRYLGFRIAMHSAVPG